MKSAFLFSVLGMILPSAMAACEVTMDGEIKTDEFLVLDAEEGAYVDCVGKNKCKDAIIKDCPAVRCAESEACFGATIVNFQNSVLCEGLHACHRTNMTAAVLPEDSPIHQTVSCLGSGACDVAQIYGGDHFQQVSCNGVKACRKVHIEGPKLVKCHNGKGSNPACTAIATFETECLYCGKDGCATHINECRYKIIRDSELETEKYQVCKPKKVLGNCPEDLEGELKLELRGKLQVDTQEGVRRLRGM